MTEHQGSPEQYYDPELLAIGERLGSLAEELGFVDTEETRQAKAALLRDVPAGQFNSGNQAHSDRYAEYQIAAETVVSQSGSPYAQIGYRIALAQLWLTLDEPDRFYGALDYGGSEGVAEMIARTPGTEEIGSRLSAILDALEALNQTPHTE